MERKEECAPSGDITTIPHPPSPRDLFAHRTIFFPLLAPHTFPFLPVAQDDRRRGAAHGGDGSPRWWRRRHGWLPGGGGGGSDHGGRAHPRRSRGLGISVQGHGRASRSAGARGARRAALAAGLAAYFVASCTSRAAPIYPISPRATRGPPRRSPHGDDEDGTHHRCVLPPIIFFSCLQILNPKG